MDENTLYEAMRYGSSNPLETRAVNDLGRFGLGLKSASLSQCRKLVVVSKQHDNINAYSWDLDYVISKGSWVIKGFSKEEIDKMNQFYANIESVINEKCFYYNQDLYNQQNERVYAHPFEENV